KWGEAIIQTRQRRIAQTATSMQDPSRPSLPATWTRFIELVRARGVKERSVRWYVIRVEQFSRWLRGKSPGECSADELTHYLTELGSRGRLQDWQFRQTVDALEIMLTRVTITPWASKFDWPYWRDS